jgi:transcriptional regulator of acetoin/glycerol metabolism
VVGDRRRGQREAATALDIDDRDLAVRPQRGGIARAQPADLARLERDRVGRVAVERDQRVRAAREDLAARRPQPEAIGAPRGPLLGEGIARGHGRPGARGLSSLTVAPRVAPRYRRGDGQATGGHAADQQGHRPRDPQVSAMREVFSQLEKIAASDATVLIEGETGTGKEGAAEAIHDASARRDRPFVVLDCSAIAANLLESELFGHEAGAFTGAVDRRIGAFEQASGDTLFLDEIGELPVELQPKLLRALESREIRRVGGHQVIRCDLRIIAATNRDLRAEVNRGSFRADLYYRLAVVRLALPPRGAVTC